VGKLAPVSARTGVFPARQSQLNTRK